MAKYRKKPVVIVEAVRVTAADYNGKTFDGCPTTEVPDWLIEAERQGKIRPVTPNNTDYAEWEIKTLDGVMLAGPGDYIVLGVTGEIYPCKGEEFEQTYEPVGGSDEKGNA